MSTRTHTRLDDSCYDFCTLLQHYVLAEAAVSNNALARPNRDLTDLKRTRDENLASLRRYLKEWLEDDAGLWPAATRPVNDADRYNIDRAREMANGLYQGVNTYAPALRDQLRRMLDIYDREHGGAR